MADVPEVTIVNGIPTEGSGTVKTNSQVIAAVEALGTKLDTMITALQIIDNMTVALDAGSLAALETVTVASLTAPLAAGSANIGDVDVASIAAGDNNIGNVDVLAADGALITLGAKADAKSAATDATAISLMQVAKQISASIQALATLAAHTYETVAASQTAQVLGPTGATGDYIDSILVIPASTSPGAVTLLDNATSIPVFAGGTDSLSNLVPFTISLGMLSASGAWKITTGADVSVIGIGKFT